MKKDVIYSMRMSRRVREALKKAARRERRTVASLLDKVISDYLEREGFLPHNSTPEERRRFPRKQVTLPAITFLRTESEVKTFSSMVLDMSLGGVLFSYPKGSDIRLDSLGQLPRFVLAVQLPNGGHVLHLDCDTRRIAEVGDEIQVGATFSNLKDEELERLGSYLM